MEMSGTNLRQPDPINWEEHDKQGGAYQVPPDAIGPDGQDILYTGLLTQPAVPDVTDEGLRKYVLGPIKIIKSGNGADGYIIKFSEPSVRLFRNGKASAVSNLVRSAGILGKFQTNEEYDAAIAAIKPGQRPICFSIDWKARNRDTGEEVRGYKNFPDDPKRPGKKMAVLHKGDSYIGKDGQPAIVQSEVLFANARIKFFQAPKKS